MRSVGILYICTGGYSRFWQGFFKSAEINLLPELSKHYFVFTDSKTLLKRKDPNVSYIYQNQLGWPFDTLYRFKMFNSIKHRLANFDFLFFFNSNLIFLEKIGNEILPEEEGLVGFQHPLFYKGNPSDYPYEKNPHSLAYIPKGAGSYYFAGGGNGGTTERYLEMISELENNISEDESNGIIAAWHDESHINKYFLDKSVKILPPSYLYPEGFDFPFSKKVLLIDKNKYGGHSFLRGDKNKFSFLLRFKKQSGYYYRRFGLSKYKLLRVLRNIFTQDRYRN